jgi:hypothetical protein
MLVSLALAGACNREPDVKDRVSKQLKDERINDVNVDYDRDTRIVHLKGTVDSAAEKQRAEQVADRVVGTSGRVANELTVKNADEHTADDMDGAIRKQLNATVANDRALEGRATSTLMSTTPSSPSRGASARLPRSRRSARSPGLLRM